MRKLADSIKTIEKLKHVLLSCLNDKEYEDITITEISEQAGINRTTFYLFFGSKDELFMQMCDSVIDRWFQPFFNLNINKTSAAENVDMEKELFRQLLAWIQQRRSALKRIPNVRTGSFDGFTLLTEGFEKRMAVQKVFNTEDEKIRKKYDLFIKLYSVGLTSILKWWLNEGDGFDAKEFHDMIERLRYKGYYSILSN